MNQTMTLTEWRSEIGLTKAARKLQSGRTFQLMLDVLKNELPTNRSLPIMGVESGYPYAYAYGVEVGYRQCIAVMESMASDSQAVLEPEASFIGDDDEDGQVQVRG